MARSALLLRTCGVACSAAVICVVVVLRLTQIEPWGHQLQHPPPRTRRPMTSKPLRSSPHQPLAATDPDPTASNRHSVRSTPQTTIAAHSPTASINRPTVSAKRPTVSANRGTAFDRRPAARIRTPGGPATALLRWTWPVFVVGSLMGVGKYLFARRGRRHAASTSWALLPWTSTGARPGAKRAGDEGNEPPAKRLRRKPKGDTVRGPMTEGAEKATTGTGRRAGGTRPKRAGTTAKGTGKTRKTGSARSGARATPKGTGTAEGTRARRAPVAAAPSSEPKHHRWLMDCYRARVLDDYLRKRPPRGALVPGAQPPHVWLDFLRFCKLAVARGVIPPDVWDWPAFLAHAGTVVYAPFFWATPTRKYPRGPASYALFGRRSRAATLAAIYDGPEGDRVEGFGVVCSEAWSGFAATADAVDLEVPADSWFADVGGREIWDRLFEDVRGGMACLQRAPFNAADCTHFPF